VVASDAECGKQTKTDQMKNPFTQMTKTRCEHQRTLVVRSVGVQRTVCEGCGHVSFAMSSDLSSFQNQEIQPAKKPLRRVAGL
jgi:hypothetical protein